MKKILSIILASVMVIGCFAGCSKSEISSKYDNQKLQFLLDKAFKKTDALKSVSLHTKSDISFGSDETALNAISTVTHLLETEIGNNSKYEMSNETAISINGMESSSYETYYKGGYFYTDRYTGNFKTKITSTEIRGDTDSSLTQIKVSDMKSLEVSQKAKHDFAVAEDDAGEKISIRDCIIVSFSCKNSIIKKQAETSLKNNGTAYTDLEIISGKGEYVVDAQGYLVSQTLEVEAKVATDGEANIMVVKSTADYLNAGKTVDPFDPEDGDYAETDNLEDIAYLDSAMSAAIANSELYITMEASADIYANDEVTGYEREYVRKFSSENKKYFQETYTTYTSKTEKTEPYLSGSYYTDGTYYSASDSHNLYIKSDMDFGTFSATVYSVAATSPADMYFPGIMSSISKEEKGDELVFEFELNPDSQGGINFLGSLFGPYSETFGGDIEAAEKTIKSFKAKSYIDKNGVYYKTEMACDILLKFEEGDVRVQAEQTVNVHNGNDIGVIVFPEFKGYESIDSSTLISGYSSYASS